MSPSARFRPLSVLIAVLLILSQLMSAAGSARSSNNQPIASNRTATQREKPARNLFRGQSADKPNPDEAEEDDPYARDDAFYSRRAAGDHPISVAEAAALREQAAALVLATQKYRPRASARRRSAVHGPSSAPTRSSRAARVRQASSRCRVVPLRWRYDRPRPSPPTWARWAAACGLRRH